ncbi:DUF51 family protein [Mycotypha africana]|uniref:DUF51 family protein n=1 Tax=Mycotypha africana TaxID=64632 RepID=UPI00230008EC|nr:DUF51 family protein [Mycotypha africana]KAI8991972.1 DUF51 family protein [Mycotypha africana]
MASSSSSSAVTEDHVKYCFKVLIAYLKKEELPEPHFPNDKYPLFVTWHKKSRYDNYELRGCIGNFNPMPLHEGLKKYALISALRDTRFLPITLAEIPQLSCAVSLLTNFEKVDDYLDWQIGKHGIWVEFINPSTGIKDTATYLPEVMVEQQWTKEEAIKSVLRKGGYHGTFSPEYCKKYVKVTRYQSEKLEAFYSEGEIIIKQ